MQIAREVSWVQKQVCKCQCVAGERVSNKLLLQLSSCFLCSTSPRCCVWSPSFRSLLNFSWPRLSVGLFLLLVLMACLSGPGCLSQPPHGNGVTKPRCCGAADQCCPPRCFHRSPEHREVWAVWEHASPTQYVAKGWKTRYSDCGVCRQLGKVPKVSLPQFP